MEIRNEHSSDKGRRRVLFGPEESRQIYTAKILLTSLGQGIAPLGVIFGSVRFIGDCLFGRYEEAIFLGLVPIFVSVFVGAFSIQKNPLILWGKKLFLIMN